VESDWGASFHAATRHLIQVLRQGGAPSLDAEAGRRVLRFGLAVRESAESQTPVTLASRHGP
jgi:predicted dehydrogenase